MKSFPLLLALILPLPATAGWFGYYHTAAEDVEATWPHTNLVHVQAANPLTVSIDQAVELHPNAQIAFEFSVLNRRFRGESGCQFGKCLDFDPARSAEILDIIAAEVDRYPERFAVLMIVDEPETNPGTLTAIADLVDDIKSRPALVDIPRVVNLDNVMPWHTGHAFVLPAGIDIFSLTPNYGEVCGNTYCEASRLTLVMDAIAEANRSGASIQWLVVGDGLGLSGKTRGLYDIQVQMARDRGIEVVGSLAFAYRYPEDFSILSGTPDMRAAWEELGADIISPPVIAPPVVQEPVIAPRPVWRWWIDDWSVNLSWLIQNWWKK
jgi:hypothetical protein